ncbi:MAG: 4Fe-4S dicluster domain-containing protein [Holophagaceae bacterium]|nr:4Fe-4S dicluster domain-containing protein [Holophagaceae bacterium]
MRDDGPCGEAGRVAGRSPGKGLGRRTFVAGLGALLSGVGRLLALMVLHAKLARAGAPEGYDPKQHRYAYGIDVDRCIGCGRCVEACKNENGVPMDSPYSRTWIERYEIREDGEVRVTSPEAGLHGFPPMAKDPAVTDAFFVPKMCNLCTHSACTQVCPVGATFDSPDGVILVDPSYCIGCAYCIQACPYGTRFMHPKTHTVDKCTLCYHRITRGLQPACVEVCPTQTRVFGDLKDPKSPILKFLRSHRLNVLKPHLGTKPQVSYANLRREVW